MLSGSANSTTCGSRSPEHARLADGHEQRPVVCAVLTARARRAHRCQRRDGSRRRRSERPLWYRKAHQDRSVVHVPCRRRVRSQRVNVYWALGSPSGVSFVQYGVSVPRVSAPISPITILPIAIPTVSPIRTSVGGHTRRVLGGGGREERECNEKAEHDRRLCAHRDGVGVKREARTRVRAVVRAGVGVKREARSRVGAVG